MVDYAHPERPGERLSHAERDAAVRALERHERDGRITPDELAERGSAAKAAKTRGDLTALFSDLPELPEPGAGTHPAQPWPGQPAPGQQAPGQQAPGQTAPGQPTAGQPGPGQPTAGQPGPAQPGPAQPSPARPGPAQEGSAQPGPARPNAGRPGPAQPGPAQPGPAQPGPMPAAGPQHPHGFAEPYPYGGAAPHRGRDRARYHDGYGYAGPRRHARPLGGRIGASIMAATPIVAVILFFITGFIFGFQWSWMWFLAIPVAGAVIYAPWYEYDDEE